MSQSGKRRAGKTLYAAGKAIGLLPFVGVIGGSLALLGSVIDESGQDLRKNYIDGVKSILKMYGKEDTNKKDANLGDSIIFNGINIKPNTNDISEFLKTEEATLLFTTSINYFESNCPFLSFQNLKPTGAHNLGKLTMVAFMQEVEERQATYNFGVDGMDYCSITPDILAERMEKILAGNKEKATHLDLAVIEKTQKMNELLGIKQKDKDKDKDKEITPEAEEAKTTPTGEDIKQAQAALQSLENAGASPEAITPEEARAPNAPYTPATETPSAGPGFVKF